jgi:sulfatase modifying factor 1
MELLGQSGRRYRLEGTPRRGGQSQVYSARGPSGERLAVKLALDAGDHSARLARERDELAHLGSEHPDVAPWLVAILDHGVDASGRVFLVLPWYEQSLAEWLEGKGLAQRLAGATAACEAVSRLHRSERDWRVGVVHRDIKPHNFLVSGEGEQLSVVLADFGGAKRGQLDTSLSIGTGIHTVGFAPPDQLLPRKAPPDVTWDVYALAVTVFWCVTGRRPYGTDMAAGLFTPEGHRLRSLAEQLSRSGRPELQSRFDSLCQRSVAELVDFSRIEPLTQEDREDLRLALSRGLGEPKPGALSEDMARDLLDSLQDALEPDPARRNPDARTLRSACNRLARQAHRQQQRAVSKPPVLGQAPSVAGWDKGALSSRQSPPAPTSPEPPRPAPPPRAPQSPPPSAVERPPRSPGSAAPPPRVGGTLSAPPLSSGDGTVMGFGAAAGERPTSGGSETAAIDASTPSPSPSPSTPPSSLPEVSADWPPPSGRSRGVLVGGLVLGVLAVGAFGITQLGDTSGYEMVLVPSGTFTMGSSEGGGDETPHEVTISRSFWVGKTEVTQGLYKQVRGENPSGFSSCGDSCPVEQVSWFDAVTFANKLSELEGLEACYVISGESVSWPRGLSCMGYRLPTEAEWEYAAGAGQSTTYAGSNELDEVGWYGDNSGMKTHPVAQKRANAWGLYDMSGNVWEWTWDWYDSSYYQSSSNVDPVGPNGGSSRVGRGGGWGSVASYARVADRNVSAPSRRDDSLGFRLSRSNP